MLNIDPLYGDDAMEQNEREKKEKKKKENGRVNEFEADLMTKIMSKMMALGVTADDIGIMAPYRSQLKLIRTKLESANVPTQSLLIDTIDRFQGSDRELVIFGLTHCPRDTKLGQIVRDWRRINVALTRSKRKLILISSVSALKASKTPVLEKLITLLAEKKWIVDVEEMDK